MVLSSVSPPPPPPPPDPDRTVRDTGTYVLVAPGADTSITAAQRPGTRSAASTLTVRVPGVVPAAGVTVNHVAPTCLAVKPCDPWLLVTCRVCGCGALPLMELVNRRERGIEDSVPPLPVVETVSVTGTVWGVLAAPVEAIETLPL